MRQYLMAVSVSIVAYIALSMGLGSFHYLLQDILPQEGTMASVSSSVLAILTFLPALLAGYIAGRLTKVRGIASGTVSLACGIALLYGPLPSEWNDLPQYILNLVIGALAGGCGELHANPKAA